MKYFKQILFCVFMLLGITMAAVDTTQVQAAAKLSTSSVKIAQGKSKKIKVKGSKKKVTWKSSNKKVAVVNKGIITAQGGGTAYVRARVAGKTLKCKVMVVSLNATELTLPVSKKYSLKVKNGKNTKWSTSNKSVATVTAKGVVKTKSAGTAVITCKSNGQTVKCKVYVPAITKTYLHLAQDQVYQLSVGKSGETCVWTSSNPAVALVDANGVVTGLSTGSAVITCKAGSATLSCKVTVGYIVTPRSSLPATSRADKLNVSVESLTGKKTYTIYKQSASVNKTSGKNGVAANYMPNHGCAACALSTVLSGYTSYSGGPVYTVEAAEKNIFGAAWKTNYTKPSDKQMPISLYGITQVLNRYGVENEYVRSFSANPLGAVQQITDHLKTGNAVVIEVRKVGNDTTWANSSHTMVLLGMTDEGYVIVADSADRSDATFGDNKRIKYTTMLNLMTYMFSSTNLISTSAYYTSASSCGGYILVNPQ